MFNGSYLGEKSATYRSSSAKAAACASADRPAAAAGGGADMVLVKDNILQAPFLQAVCSYLL
jgi:hypothetical protein